jgi:hypothetical protein
MPRNVTVLIMDGEESGGSRRGGLVWRQVLARESAMERRGGPGIGN